MNDRLIYYFISCAALLNIFVLILSGEYNKCYNNQFPNYLLIVFTLFCLFLHYFLHCFSLYGFLFDDKILLWLYLIIPPIIWLGWLINKTEYFKSACLLTNATDLLCKLSRQNGVRFIEIYRYLGVPDISIGYTCTCLAFVILTIVGYPIAIYKLLKK